jgi:hypothetical protein
VAQGLDEMVAGVTHKKDRQLADPVVVSTSCWRPGCVGLPPAFRPSFYLLRRGVCWRRGHRYVRKKEGYLLCERCGCYWLALMGRFMESEEAELLRWMRGENAPA